MTRKRKLAIAILSLLLLCNLCFIWGNSLAGPDSSHDFSLNFLHFLPAFLQNLVPDPDSLLYIVRKMAHFSEFACLGGLSTGLLVLCHKVGIHSVLHVLAGGFFTAAIDETIQIFSHRGSQLQDVWLDFSGFTVGLVVVLLLRAVLSHSKPVITRAENVIPFPTTPAQKDHYSK